MKTIKEILLYTAAALLFTATILAADPVTAPAADTVTVVTNTVAAPAPAANDAVSKLIVEQAAKHPWIITILTVLGIAARLIQPTVDYLHKVVKETPTTKDDEFLAKIEGSTVLKWLNKILSYCAGINLIHPDKR